MPSRWMIVSAMLVAGLVCRDVLAQQTSSRSSGSSASGSRSSTGSSSTRSLGSGVTAGTRTSIGGTGRASGAGSSGNFGVGSAGMVNSSDRFVRTSRQASAFVGSDSSDTREFVGSVTAGSASGSSGSRNIRAGGGGSSGRGSSANANRGRGGGGPGRQTDEVRVTLNVGFALPLEQVAVETRELAAAKLAGRMARSTWIQRRSPLEVTLAQGTATLRGVVATEHDRALAERLALLEPGISTVKNELMVQPPESAAPVPPKSNTSP